MLGNLRVDGVRSVPRREEIETEDEGGMAWEDPGPPDAGE